MTLTLFSLALCVDCGRETIGGRGHAVDCHPAQVATELERVAFQLIRLQTIRARHRGR